MTEAAALAHLTKQAEDPVDHWLTAERHRLSLSQAYTDMPSVLGLVAEAISVIAGAGLTGGGDLSANRTLTVDFGTGADQVRHGNDAVHTNARTPTAHVSTHVTGGADPLTPADIGAESAGAATTAQAEAIAVSAQKAANLSDLASATTALANLGGAPRLVPEVTYTAAATLALVDGGALVRVNSATPVDVTVPPNDPVAFPVGTQILVVQYGAGQVRFVAGSGVTLRSAYGRTRIATQYDQAVLVKRATNEWYLAGGLTQ